MWVCQVRLVLAKIHGPYLMIICLAPKVSVVADISHSLGGRKEASLCHYLA